MKADHAYVLCSMFYLMEYKCQGKQSISYYKVVKLWLLQYSLQTENSYCISVTGILQITWSISTNDLQLQ